MDDSSASAPWYWRSKPLGKVRRRVQDLRISSPSCYEGRTALDLSHNESARLAVDSLLSRGLEGYHEVLNTEGEVDFLSQLEKIYILENGRDGNTGPDLGASDESDTEFDSLSTGSQSVTQCTAVSTDSDPILASLDLSSQKGSTGAENLYGNVKQTDPALDKPDVEVYFQSDNSAASMKDLVREFLRKAGMTLAIVMDSFSDVELLCDLLEASRKRNVSVHLLLDHFHLNLFISMWQELKLNSKYFPKLSVHSVDGQTYCAKTGRKLTGQIAESFIISDWTEVLTGSYSFSWLSWQTHRSLAVLLKGSAVTPFHKEFLRLHSSSKPIPGFDTFITVPHALPLYTTLHAAQSTYNDPSKSKPGQKTICPRAQKEDGQDTQTKAKIPVLSNSQSAELECSKSKTQLLPRAGAGTHEKSPQLCLKSLVQPGSLQSVSVGEHTTGAGFTQLGPQTHVENNARAQESNPLHTASPTHKQHRILSYQSTFRTNLEHHYVGTERLFFHQRNRNRLTEHPGIGAGLDTQRRQWNYLLNFKPKADFLSDNPKVLLPSTLQQKQAKTDMWLPLTHQRGDISVLQTKVSSLGTRRQDPPQRPHQPSLQLHKTTEAPGSKSASSAMGAHLQPQLQSDSNLFLPGTGATQHLHAHTSQQSRPPPRLNWMRQSRTERPRPVARHSSFSTTYGTGQQTDGQVGWRPFHSSMNTSVRRSQSMAHRQLAGLNPNITKL